MLVHQTLLGPLTVLGYILATSIATWHDTALQAFAVPIPAQLARQAPYTFNNTYFPYVITGPAPPPRYRPGEVLDQCTKPNSYAISFDDGPGQLTDELLDYLQEHNLKVTFFMNGDNWSCIYHPESQRLLKRAYDDQHQIAAHPWSHQDLGSISDQDIRQEMHRIEQAFRQIIGVVPRYMRPPFGGVGERARRILEEMGYLIILWDVDRLNQGPHYPLFSSSSSSTSDEKPMAGSPIRPHFSSRQDPPAYSKWLEAIHGVSSGTLDREAMMSGGIYQDTTPDWAIEYVQSLGYDVMPVGQCLGEEDPRLWYKEIGPAAEAASVPQSCR